MKKLLTLLFFFPLFALAQTCDVDLIGYDPETHEISVAILNGENCGCNEFTQQDGNTCEESSSSVVNNNESITHFVFGLHVYEDFTEGPCSQADFHPGWTFAYPPNQNTLQFTGGHVTGDTVNVQLTTFNDWDCLLEQDFDEECLELVVWQINLGQTADINDFPDQFWTDTCGVCADQTHMYPDIDLSNNTLVWCPDELPPPPLYPGCTDEEADNYDPESTFDDGSCFYTVVGCTDPIACNYNNSANTPDNENCIYCDTPNGEELCNAYHGEGSDYWEFYANIFDCNPVVDLELDSVYFVDANCNIFNSNIFNCNEGLRFNISYKNKGEVPIDSWYFSGTLNGWEWESVEYGINFPQAPFNQPLPPGGSPGDLNVYTADPVWEEGDTLFATIHTVGIEDNTPSNNSGYFILPSYPICIEGCTDPEANNYNPDATCDIECEYPLGPNGSIDSLIISEGCEDLTPYWEPTLILSNTGETDITEFCVKFNVLGQYLDTLCFEEIIPIGDSIELQWPVPLYDYGTISIHMLDINGVSDQEWNDFGDDIEISNNMFTSVVGNPGIECANPELFYVDTECELICDENGPYYNAIVFFDNIGNTTINNFCIEWDIIGAPALELIECFEGELPPGESVIIELGPVTTDGGGGVVIRLQSLEGEETDITWFQPISCFQQAEAICVYGCTDPTANNYLEAADIDDGSCEYDITELTYIDAECFVDCDLSGPFYYVNTTWTNTGNIEITDFCAEWDVIGGDGDDTECFNGSLMPGDTTGLLFGPYTSEQGLLAWAYLQALNGVTFDPPIENYETLYCWADAEASCIYGCIDATANNYDPTADLDDGSCTYDIFGCTDPEANNYSPAANIDDGSCTYDVLGCTDSDALNYNPLANIDDGSCEYDVFGCTDPAATNYNPLATVDDNSCEYVIYLGGCTDPEAANYNPMATYDDGSCYYLPEPCDGSYYAPNVFTPNNDGVNDGWTVVVADPDCWRSWYMAIYNRWGGLVWESTTVGEIWPASIFGGNHYVADGVYVYLVRGEGWNPDHTFKTTGHITIFR